MQRSKKIILISHCIMNANAKVEGLSDYSATVFELVQLLEEKGLGIIQLPCPEMMVEGIRRWGKVKEQYDTHFYRNQYQQMLLPILYQLKSYVDAGYTIVGMIGVDGSPSCGVELTCSGNFRGEISKPAQLQKVLGTLEMIEGQGVFIEELQKLLADFELEVPFIGINEENVYESMDKIKRFLE